MPRAAQKCTPTQPSAAPSVQLTRFITDPSGKLTAAGHTAVESALSTLSARHNVHLWVAYVDDFSGLTPIRWAENAMRTNGFTDTDGLLAIDTTNRTFAFRAPKIMKVNTEFIRKERIAPAVHRDEWARAAVAAANGLESCRLAHRPAGDESRSIIAAAVIGGL